MSETNRTALVTGANSGIGLEIAKQLLAGALDVLVGARDAAKGTESCERLGPGAHPVFIDVTDEASIARAALEVDRLDVLVNNAGLTRAARTFRTRRWSNFAVRMRRTYSGSSP